jgi:hypothetical protein
MALYPGYGVRNLLAETATIVQAPKAEHPGSDQGVLYLGELPYPFAPPLIETDPPIESFSEPNPPFPNPEGILNELS